MRYGEWNAVPDGGRKGAYNSIADVEGVTVGHHTVRRESPRILRTGVSAIRIEGLPTRPVMAACHAFNGYGKSMGLMQVEELGTMESHIFLTNTLSIGAVQQGVVQLALAEKSTTRTFNAMVMECNDGTLSDIGALAVTPEMAAAAFADARADFAPGSVGAGAGMTCFGFKGGIGSASRLVTIEGTDYTMGALVLSNFGRMEDLRIPGVERTFAGQRVSEKGSIIMIAATNLPMMPHQLKRVARHVSLAIGILGAPGYHGSGDVALAFSTANRGEPGAPIHRDFSMVNDDETMSAIFRAAVWATVEAILDSMFLSPATTGFRGNVGSLRDVLTNP